VVVGLFGSVLGAVFGFVEQAGGFGFAFAHDAHLGVDAVDQFLLAGAAGFEFCLAFGASLLFQLRERVFFGFGDVVLLGGSGAGLAMARTYLHRVRLVGLRFFGRLVASWRASDQAVDHERRELGGDQ
jgi:hypothetical protein